MRIFNREKPEGSQKKISISALGVGLVMAFVFGVAFGYQWGNQPYQEDEEETVAQRLDIPIDEDDGTRGSPDAPVVIIEFTDYECYYCNRYYTETFSQIIEAYGDQIYYVVKDLPLPSIHPNAIPSAKAVHCASEQDAFWEYHDMLFGQALGLSDEAYQSYAQGLGLDMSAFNDCLDNGRYDQLVLADIDVLEANRIPLSTPTFFINGQYLAGAQPFSVFSEIIETELAAAE
jgi:protein-disulfide isomerase